MPVPHQWKKKGVDTFEIKKVYENEERRPENEKNDQKFKRWSENWFDIKDCEYEIKMKVFWQKYTLSKF